MIYTIGLTFKYAPAFAAGRKVVKQGRGVDDRGRPYPGGFVFQTDEEARRFIDGKGLTATHSIMGVLADWETDAEPVPGEPYRRLLRSAEVVSL